MSDDDQIIVIGAGQAGGSCAIFLRDKGYDGPITLIGDEGVVPYERPPLSKTILIGDGLPDSCFLRPVEYYSANNIDLYLSDPVVGLCRGRRLVRLRSGRELHYGQLVFATGARARRLPVPGGDLPGVHYLRTMADSLALRGKLLPGLRILVVGGGFLGLEVAASARHLGCEVTVLELSERVLSRVMVSEVALRIEEEHRAHGVAIQPNCGVRELKRDGATIAASLTDGTQAIADIVIVGAGAVPNDELARQAGLPVDDGILIDRDGRSIADERVHAIGDVARIVDDPPRCSGRLESWKNAQDQALNLSAKLAGQDESVREPPWFWSNQYDLNIQMIGDHTQAEDTILRSDGGIRGLTAVGLCAGKVVSGVCVNNARDMRYLRELIKKSIFINKEKLLDDKIKLKSMI